MIRKIYNLLPTDSFIRRTLRFIKRQYYTIRENKFMNVSLSKVEHINCSSQSDFLLITVAFNNPVVISHQIRLLRKYLLDSFQYIVVDNSSLRLARKEIYDLCEKNNVGYVSLSPNFYKVSNSHGLALNWAYRHLVKTNNPTYVGFLDHDVYPIRTHRIVPILEKQLFFGQQEIPGSFLEKQSFYKQQEKPDSVWWLWPGFCFFRANFLNSANFDFKPGMSHETWGDTGILLYASLLKDIDISDYQFPSVHFQQIREGNDAASNMVEYFLIEGEQSWVHTFNAGYWKKALPKEQLIESILNQY